MGIFSSIFTSKGGEKVIDGIYNGIDMSFFTAEERAKMAIERAEIKLKMLPLLEPFKIAQRFLALVFAVNFLISFWVGIALFMWKPDYLDGFLNIVGIFQLGWIMLAIIGFYFGGGFLESYKAKK